MLIKKNVQGKNKMKNVLHNNKMKIHKDFHFQNNHETA